MELGSDHEVIKGQNHDQKEKHYLYRRPNIQGKPIVFYLHPWELDPDQPRTKVRLDYQLRHYINLKKTEKRLEKLLSNFKFVPLMNIADHYFPNSKPFPNDNLLLATDYCPLTIDE